MEGYSTPEDALNAYFRGHIDRDFNLWSEEHFYENARDIPLNATKAWITRQKSNYRDLGKRTALKHLIAEKVDQTFLEEIGNLSELERLELEGPTTAKDLAPLLQLNKLSFISIEGPRHVGDFAPLLSLPSLRTLIITDAKLMADLEWLSEAHDLEVIGIEGSTWTDFLIPTLKPLSGLRSLRAFLGVSTRLEDRSLVTLAKCPKLEFVGIARVAPKEDFEALKQARPDLICSWFKSEMWSTL